MDAQRITVIEHMFRCGLPTWKVKDWLAQHASEGLRIATYSVSTHYHLGHYIPPQVPFELLVGVSGINPEFISDLRNAPVNERWHRLLRRLTIDEQKRLLHILRRLGRWQRAGATVRLALPGQFCGLMHLKLFLGKNVALFATAN